MTRIKTKVPIIIAAIPLIEPIADQRPSAISIRRRTTIRRNTQRRNIISLEITIRDTSLILRAVIRVTLTTTLSNTPLLTKEIKTKI